MSEFVLKLHEIDSQGKDFAFPLRDSWLDQVLADTPLSRDETAVPGSFTGHVQRNGDEILIDARVQAGLSVACGRCLADTRLAVDSPVTALLTRGVAGEAIDELELSREDLDRGPGRFQGNELVLDEVVREHLVLECPMQPLCSTECPGIEVPESVRPDPKDFGGEGELDPRLAPLKELKAKLSKDKE